MNQIKTFFLRKRMQYEKWITETNAALENAPEGSLIIRCIRGKIRYYHKNADGKEKYIPQGNEAFVRALAQKSYNRKLLQLLNAMEQAIQLFLKLCPESSIEELYRTLSPHRQTLVTPLFPTQEQYIQEWLSKPYTPKGFYPGDTTAFYTKKGLRVRSKSELLIAELLDSLNIPYKYECPLVLNGITIYPDFTILDVKNRCEVYLEHCGMLGDQDYSTSFVERNALYESNQLFQGKRVILTFETRDCSINTRNLQSLLRERFKAA